MHHLKKLITAVFLTLILICEVQSAKNVIILIGDGLGISAIGITKYHSKFVKNTPYLNIEKIAEKSNMALLYTYSKSSLVPDSSSAATSFACGIKTLNGKVGVDENDLPVENVLELAQKKGKSTGLISTTAIIDATPAAFSAHVPNRSEGMRIAKQQLEKKINVLLGGGRAQFDLTYAKQQGYSIVSSAAELRKIDPKETNLLLGLFSPDNMSYYGERKSEEPTLVEMTKKALEILSLDPDGFFLMIEGGRIDHALHDNKIENALLEIYEFDQTIGIIAEFIEKNKDTLVILTADHNTGGSTITKDDFEFHKYPTVNDLKNLRGIFWTSKHHTGCPVILLASGPGAEKVNGFKENTFVYQIIADALK